MLVQRAGSRGWIKESGSGRLYQDAGSGRLKKDKSCCTGRINKAKIGRLDHAGPGSLGKDG